MIRKEIQANEERGVHFSDPKSMRYSASEMLSFFCTTCTTRVYGFSKSISEDWMTLNKFQVQCTSTAN